MVHNMIEQTELSNIKQNLGGFYIPSNPKVITQLDHQFSLAEVDIIAVADIVATDIGLSSAVLKTINSPYYGMSRSICDIKQATILLGVTALDSLLNGVKQRNQNSPESCISLERFWDNASDIANTMDYIGENIKTKLPKEHLRTVGLFHDCGIPAFASKYPDYINTLARMDAPSSHTNVDIEDQQYNSNHAVMGYYIACSWFIPKDICEIILHHHDIHFLTSDNDEHVMLTFATLKAAENMIEKAKRFKETSDWQFIKYDVCDTLGFDIRDYQDLEDDICQMMC